MIRELQNSFCFLAAPKLPFGCFDKSTFCDLLETERR
jgi:hypothetical protein